MPSIAMKRPLSPLFWLVLLFIGTRLLYLLLIHPDRISPDPTNELYRGTIAKEIVSGLHLPFLEYRADNHSGGSLVVALIAAGFFRLLGPHLFALKLTSLLFFTLALACWYPTIDRLCGRRMAVYFGLLFSLSPPIFTAFSLTTIGYHSESVFFTALTIWLFFTLRSNDQAPLSSWALLGFTAGLGLWFTYIYGLTLLSLALFWFWQGRDSIRWKPLICFAVFFVAGFSPWLVFNVQYDFAGLSIRAVPLWNNFGLSYLMEPFSNFRSFVLYQFFDTLASDSPLSLERRMTNLSYALLYLVPATGLFFLVRTRSVLPSDRHTSEGVQLLALGLVYLGLFALAVQGSWLKAVRFNIAAYPFLFLFLAYGMVCLEDRLRPMKEGLKIFFVSSLILVWLATHSVLFSLDGSGYALTAKGYAYRHLLEFQLCRTCDSDEEALKELEQKPALLTMIPELPPDDRHELSLSLVQFLASTPSFTMGRVQIDRLQRLIPPGYDRHFYYLLGREAADHYATDFARALDAVEFLRAQSTSAYRFALSGLCHSWSQGNAWPEVWPTTPSPESLLNRPVPVPPDGAPFYWRAVGQYAARVWYGAAHSVEHVRNQGQAFVHRLDPAVQRPFLQGIGLFVFSRWQASPVFTLPFAPLELERFPGDLHPGLFEGVGLGLGEFQMFHWVAWKGHTGIIRHTTTAGLSDPNVGSLEKGRREFFLLFEESVITAPPAGARDYRGGS